MAPSRENASDATNSPCPGKVVSRRPGVGVPETDLSVLLPYRQRGPVGSESQAGCARGRTQLGSSRSSVAPSARS